MVAGPVGVLFCLRLLARPVLLVAFVLGVAGGPGCCCHLQRVLFVVPQAVELPIVGLRRLLLAGELVLRAAVLACLAVLTVVVAVALIQLGATVGGLFDRAPGDLHPLVAELRHGGTRRLYADYWVAQRVTLETDEKIVAAPVSNVRYQPY